MRFFSIPAIADIIDALKDYSLVGMLGWQDVRQRYKRSKLGAFWLTISMGVMIGTMGIVFSKILKYPITQFLPFLSIGMIVWGFISSAIIDGAQGFISAHYIIKQLPIPLFSHIARSLWRNIIVLGHNLVIFPLVILIVGHPLSWIALISIPGFLLLIINLAWITLFLGILCSRYRDLPQIIGSVLQIVFYLTPIMWAPNNLSSQRTSFYLVQNNPLYHLLQIIRAPLLGELPTLANWIVSVALALGGWCVTLIIYNRYQHRIAYWI